MRITLILLLVSCFQSNDAFEISKQCTKDVTRNPLPLSMRRVGDSRQPLHTKPRRLRPLRGGAAVLAVAKQSPSPRLWIGPALVCALAYATYNLFIKRASDSSIDPMFGGVLLQFVAAFLGTIVLLIKRSMNASATLTYSRSGVLWAIAAGVAVGIAELLSFVVSGMGVQAMQSIPIIVGGSVLFGTLLGNLWLKESLSLRGLCGVVLIAIGIAIVGLDTGGASMH